MRNGKFWEVKLMANKLFIYLTSFLCGMSVMAVETSATRLLAPTFGTSSIIWTIVIGLIMISMSLGNVLGGRSVDKHNSLDRLFKLIWIAAVWVAVIPLVGKYIISFSVVALMLVLPNNLLIAGSVFSCLVIFSFPLVIFGMVSPYLVKLGVKDMKDAGKTTGEIYALSTIGSIIGTFIPTFITIPTIGTSKTFFVFALFLNLICLYYFAAKKMKVIRVAATVIIFAALIVIPFNNSYAFWKSNILYEGESLYNYLQVSEDKDSVILSTNVAFGVQSIYKKNSILTGMYYDYALMAPFFMKDTGFDKQMDMLILGLGTGTYAKQCKRFFPNTSTDGVEIDKKITELSKKYFELKDDEANIFINDGRTFLSSKDVRDYDLIMVDAYHDITIPFHMSTQEFFTEVRKHLKPGGVLVININMRSDQNTEITEYLTQTVKSVMKKVYKYDLTDGTNTIVFASDDESCEINYRANIGIMNGTSPLKNISATVSKNLREVTESGLVFTDEVAPVEMLGQKVLDDIVKKELDYYKERIKSKGLRGIFDVLSE